jgi:2-polyprenyl-3-methyl-5-hydroxy-6-metoxy-1,4-benzoquinol methylase
MKRLVANNINTPEYFNKIWHDGTARYDRVRYNDVIKYIKPNDIVCDFGAGYMGWSQYLLDQRKDVKANVCALDYSEEAKKLTLAITPGLCYKIGDVLDSGYPSNVFDVVASLEVVEHLEEPWKLADEMIRVCRPGGTIIIGTVDPDCHDSIKNGCKYPEHLWQFTNADLIHIVAHAGETTYKRVGNYDHIYCIKSIPC